MLSASEVESFVADGYVAIRGAVPADTVRACRDVIWSELAKQGVAEHDPATWTQPVVRIPCPEGGPFADAGTRPVLWEAFDQLIGPGRWWRRPGVGGTVPVRFPSEGDPGDAGWHIEASYESAGHRHVNIRSRARGLLALYLFSDVDADTVPTRLRPGSHRDAARVLAPAGDAGLPWIEAAQAAAMRPRRGVHEEGMAHEHVSRLAGGQQRRPARARRRGRLRRLGPGDPGVTGRRQHSRRVTVRSRSQPGRRAVGVHVAEQVQRQQATCPGADVDAPVAA